MRIPDFIRRIMLRRARQIMANRPPDFIIRPTGEDYLKRWWLINRNKYLNIYLHRFIHSDDDRALHDHPWSNASILLDGSYIEHTLDGKFERQQGYVYFRKAECAHRVELHKGDVITLFITGPWKREWGFLCPKGWRSWKIFCDDTDYGKVGRGCE